MAENTITDLESYYDTKTSGIFSEEAQSSFDPTFGFTGPSADAAKAFAENSNLSNETGPSDGIPRSSAPFRYPYTKIDEHDDYMKLEIVEFVAPGLDRISDNELNPKISYYSPLNSCMISLYDSRKQHRGKKLDKYRLL